MVAVMLQLNLQVKRYPMRLDARYIAGFLDADGSIYIAKFRRKEDRIVYLYPQVSFVSQNLGVLSDIKETVGGHWSHTPQSRQKGGAYGVVVGSEKAVKCLESVLPYLRVKREQALLVLQFSKLVAAKKRERAHADGRTAIITADEYQERLDICEQVKALNRRDSIAYRKNRVNSVEAPSGVTPSQAAVGEGTAEGVTTREMSPNNNSLHEDPARKGRHSLDSTVAIIQ